jgi:hypothetical protein
MDIALDELAHVYLRHYQLKRQEDFWAVEEGDHLVDHDADLGWALTKILIDKAVSDEALAYVAAGPLEDLLKKHGFAVIKRVEEECRTNSRLQLALSGVWLGREYPIYYRWYALMWKYGFAEGRRRPL